MKLPKVKEITFHFRKRRRLIDKQTKSRLNERRMTRKRLLANQQNQLNKQKQHHGNIKKVFSYLTIFSSYRCIIFIYIYIYIYIKSRNFQANDSHLGASATSSNSTLNSLSRSESLNTLKPPGMISPNELII